MLWYHRISWPGFRCTQILVRENYEPQHLSANYTRPQGPATTVGLIENFMCILAVPHLFRGRLIVVHDFAPRDNVRPSVLLVSDQTARWLWHTVGVIKKVRISVSSAEQPVLFCSCFPPVYFVICSVPCHTFFVFASFSATFHVLHDESSTSVD